MRWQGLLCGCGFLLVTALNTSAKGWQDITPLRSTCEDVKRILKVDRCDIPESEYQLPNLRVIIYFSPGEYCDGDPYAWRVPRGTVTSLIISPTKKMCPSELKIDVSRYERLEDGDVVGSQRYASREEGITVLLFNGFVQDIFFYPPAREKNLICKPSSPLGLSAERL